jgi:hypothetical protein
VTTELPTLPGMELPEAARSFLEAGGPGMGEYSGEVLRARHPQLYRAAVELLGRGYGIRDTAKILSMSARSIMAIRDREPDTIATVKRYVSRKYLDVATLAAEVARDRLTDEPESIPFKDLMIGGAVAVDKHLILAGEATQRIEHVVRPAEDEYERLLHDARARGLVIEGELVPDTDIALEDPGQRGAPSAEAGAGPGVRHSLAEGEAIDIPLDMQSSVDGSNPLTNGAGVCSATGGATGPGGSGGLVAGAAEGAE